MSGQPWPMDAAPTIVLILYVVIGYIAYTATGALPSESAPGRRKPSRVMIDRLAFFIAFFLLPFIIFSIAGIDMPGIALLGGGSFPEWLLCCALLCVTAWLIARYSRKSVSQTLNYPQYLPGRWTMVHVMMEITGWAMYVFAYEFVFRGVVLHMLLPLGNWLAVVVSTGLYAFAHLAKNTKEAAAATLFGIIAAVVTLQSESIWPIFLIHLALALGNDAGCFSAFKKSGNRSLETLGK